MIEVTDCEKCPALVACRKCIVNGLGKPGASIMFVGQNPGVEEDDEGKPFVGKSGRLLRLLCDAAGIPTSMVYRTNAVRCHSPGNRIPKHDEIVNCRPYLMQEIQELNPAVIVTLGQVPLQSLIAIDGGEGYHNDLNYWESECDALVEVWQQDVTRWQGLDKQGRLNDFPGGKPRKPKMTPKPKPPKRVHVTLKDTAGQTLHPIDITAPVIPTYHPAFLMRGKWDYSELVIAHFEKARRIAEQ